MPPQVEILLVGGLHPNEACAPLMASEVFKTLSAQAARVALFHIPYRCTLLAFIDDPATADTTYSMPPGQGRLDVDLDALDEYLARCYPGALVFEFHNSEDSQPMLGIDPRKDVQEYEVGAIGPRFERPYEIGTWRDVDRLGRPAKYVIEAPACYVPVTPPVLERRQRRLSQLHEEGYGFEPQWLHYLEARADVEASRRRGYLDGCLAQKVADWIISCTRL